MKKLILNNLHYGLLFALIVLVMGYRLWYPPVPFYDEIHYVRFVKELIYHNVHFSQGNQHPPLWHLLMAFCIELFGDHPFSWRVISFVAHIGVVYVTFRLAEKLTGNKLAACLAVFLLLFDCLSLTQARIAMMNSLMLLFILLSINFFLDAFKNERSYDHKALRKAGIFWALAIVTKMVSLNLLIFFIPLLVMQFRQNTAERRLIIKDLIVYFLLFPVALMFCVYIFVPFIKGLRIVDMWNIQVFNFQYHATTHQTHGYSSRWWSWPLLLRPICYYFNAHNWNGPGGSCETILSIGNPVLFWTIPFAFFNTIWEFALRRGRVYGIILLGLLSQWLSFALGNRLQFFHYFYHAMPFVVMAVALLLLKVYTWGRWGRYLVILYLIAVAGMFVYWYPILTGMTISRSYFYQHMWFRSWI